MKKNTTSYHFDTIAKLMRHAGHPTPLHPLITLVDYSKHPVTVFEKDVRITLDFYKISFKNNFSGHVRYGQGFYDFEEGGLAFLQPGQVVITSGDSDTYEGYVLYFHPDFIRSYPLGSEISGYGFFSYDVSEALFLSTKEKAVIQGLFNSIAAELENNIDQFSQDVLISQIGLLLNYSNRFYNRQFITRKTVSHQILSSLDGLLAGHFKNNDGLKHGLPSVKFVSEQLNVSQRYLSDMLRSLTGLNTQQYIQDRVIERSKVLLSSTSLSVSEIAYGLGFEHPQSFSKVFKIKTNKSPLEFRQSFM